MKKVTIKASKRVYIVFSIMFGWMPISIFILAYFKGTILRDLPIILVTSSILLLVYGMLAIYKITYDNNEIKYRGLFGTKSVNIKDIKRYKIKAEVHTISTKPIFGLFRISINNPIKPIFGLAIDTIRGKSEIIIPAKLFSSEDLNNLMEHINIINGSPKGKANAGKSVFSYREKKKKV